MSQFCIAFVRCAAACASALAHAGVQMRRRHARPRARVARPGARQARRRARQPKARPRVAAARLAGDAYAGGSLVGEASDPAANLDGVALDGPTLDSLSEQSALSVSSPDVETVESHATATQAPVPSPSAVTPGIFELRQVLFQESGETQRRPPLRRVCAMITPMLKWLTPLAMAAGSLAGQSQPQPPGQRRGPRPVRATESQRARAPAWRPPPEVPATAPD